MVSSWQLRIINRIGTKMIRRGKYASYHGEEYGLEYWMVIGLNSLVIIPLMSTMALPY